MLCVIMLSIVMLNVVMLNVTMLRVVVPLNILKKVLLSHSKSKINNLRLPQKINLIKGHLHVKFSCAFLHPKNATEIDRIDEIFFSSQEIKISWCQFHKNRSSFVDPLTSKLKCLSIGTIFQPVLYL
jgi:hypothetical protein